MATDITAPSAKESEKAHKNADTDSKPTGVHHTLGPGLMQASPGNHTHDGGASVTLLPLEGVTLVGNEFASTPDSSLISALVKLGAIDATGTQPEPQTLTEINTNINDKIAAIPPAPVPFSKVDGGQVFIAGMATGTSVNFNILWNTTFSGMRSVVLTPYNTSRLTMAVLSFDTFGAVCQAMNWSGAASPACAIGWVAVGT